MRVTLLSNHNCSVPVVIILLMSDVELKSSWYCVTCICIVILLQTEPQQLDIGLELVFGLGLRMGLEHRFGLELGLRLALGLVLEHRFGLELGLRLGLGLGLELGLVLGLALGLGLEQS